MGVRTAVPIVSLMLVTLLAAAALGGGAKPAPSQPAKPAAKNGAVSYTGKIAPLLKKYCVNCHGSKQQIGGIDVTAYKDEASVLKAREIWEHIAQNLSSGNMPPKNAPQPSAADRAATIAWIEALLSQADCEIREPGAVTLRRLNRVEYNNTVRDLLAPGSDWSFRPADDFPSDDVGYGFDNIGDVLSLSPLLMEKYLDAAEQISQKAIVAPEDGAKVDRVEVEDLANGGQVYENNYILLGRTDDAVQRRFSFEKDGEYLIRIRAFGQLWGDEPPKMELKFDDQVVTVFDVAVEEEKARVYTVKLPVTAGRKPIKATYTNNFNTNEERDPKKRGDRNLVVDYLEVVGPLVQRPNGLPESHRNLITVQPTEGQEREAARKILEPLARRAFRRPVAAEEIERILRLYDASAREGDSFERAIRTAIQGILVSPHFLFRVELNAPAESASERPLNGWELASRLSYFLWSSMPDEELFSLAESGRLQRPEVLETQARRMLRDRKSRALVENFGQQWLTLRNLKTAAPDPQRFPTFNDELRDAMLKETELFLEHVIRQDRSVLELFTADYTFLNERLAKHYGVLGVTGPEFRLVKVPGGQRGGILKQASILTVTSNPSRTNPVKRGKWILEQILGTPPPPPPPDVPELPDDGGKMLVGTLRERLEQHRKDPGCASCHTRLDPLGFALENYDAVGAWRVKDGEEAVDASGVLPNGDQFKGPADFQGVLLKQKKQVVRNLSERMLTYALGRGTDHKDRCVVDEIAANVTKADFRFSALVTTIVKSEPFRKQSSDRSGK
jgi:mono/diheme cytochrome c family protein